MKKHVGMSKSSQLVKLSSEALKTIEIKANDCNEHMKTLISEFLSSSTMNEQIHSIKKITSSASSCSEMITPIYKVVATVYFDQTIYKTALHKTAGSCLESIGKSIDDFNNDLYSIISQFTNGKKFVFCVKCLLESPVNSLRHQAVKQNITEYLKTTCNHLVDMLNSMNTGSTHHTPAETYQVDLIHTTAQMYYRLLSLLDDENIDSIVTGDSWSSLKAAFIKSLETGCGNMDLQITVGLCLARMVSLQYYNSSDFINEFCTLLSSTHKAVDEDFYKICLLNGLVSCQKHDCLSLHELIFTCTEKLIAIKMYTVTCVVFTKMLTCWTNLLCKEDYRSFVEVKIFLPVFNYLFYVWEHTTEVIRQASREIFYNLLRAVRGHSGLSRQSLQVISTYPWTRKGKYGFLIEYTKVFGTQSIIDQLCKGSTEDLLLEFIPAIERQQLANYVGEFVCCVINSDKNSTAYTTSEWLDRWLIPLVKVIEKNPDSQRHVSQNLLPRIIKLWPEATVDLLKWLSDQQTDSSNWLDIYLMMASQARCCGLLAEGELTDNLWCGVLSKDLIGECLHSAISERRLSAFGLICQSHKTSSPISQEEFVWVERFMKDNSYHTEPSFRQRMLSHLKHFLYHVLESSRKVDAVDKQPYQKFLRDLGSSQIDKLTVESSANHRTVALEVLTLISQIFPYSATTQ